MITNLSLTAKKKINRDGISWLQSKDWRIISQTALAFYRKVACQLKSHMSILASPYKYSIFHLPIGLLLGKFWPQIGQLTRWSHENLVISPFQDQKLTKVQQSWQLLTSENEIPNSAFAPISSLPTLDKEILDLGNIRNLKLSAVNAKTTFY